jgi:hypothetical protein
MLLNKINYNNVQYNLYNRLDNYLQWHTIETEAKRKVFYSVREDGLVISTSKKTYKEKIVKSVLSGGVLVVRINRKVYKVKNLVAKYFTNQYKDGMCVLLKDKNPYNCSINNLIICDKKKAGKLTGGLACNKPIIANGRKYNSIIEFCRKNYIGQRTFYDAKQKRYKTSILDEFKIKQIK